ncbi:MAG: hypothetical protein DRQ24_12090, partial [Candidatus Latescibacterota bacterium]
LEARGFELHGALSGFRPVGDELWVEGKRVTAQFPSWAGIPPEPSPEKNRTVGSSRCAFGQESIGLAYRDLEIGWGPSKADNCCCPPAAINLFDGSRQFNGKKAFDWFEPWP